MGACVKIFDAIDPNSLSIATVAGNQQDTIYCKLTSGSGEREWVVWDFISRKMEKAATSKHDNPAEADEVHPGSCP